MAYNFKHRMLQFGLLSLLHLHIGIAQANDDTGNLWYFNPRVGLSYATGNVGFEVQKSHYAIALGVIALGGVGAAAALKYYFEPRANSLAVGLFSTFTLDEDAILDGDEWNATGISLDYRAIDVKGWEASVGIGLAKVNEESGATTSEYVTLLPAITFGRAF